MAHRMHQGQFPLGQIKSATACDNFRTAFHLQTQSLLEVQIAIQGLQEFMLYSEENIKEAIAKYVSDKNFEKHLLKLIGSYTRVQSDGEQKINSLALDLIQEQALALRNHRDYSEATIISIQKKNQELEEENIQLLKKIEKLQLRLMQHPGDSDSTTSPNNDIYMRNNEKLRNKLAVAQNDLTQAESKRQEMQTIINTYADHVTKLKMEIENQKLMRVRWDADKKIEHAVLSKELYSLNSTMNEMTEVADALLSEMETLQENIKKSGYRVRFKWDMLRFQSGNAVNVMHICQSLIGELGSELINVYKLLVEAEEDMSSLRDDCDKLKLSLRNVTKEKEHLKEKCEVQHVDNESAQRKLTEVTHENIKLQGHLVAFSRSAAALENGMFGLRKGSEDVKMHQHEKADLEKQVYNLTVEKKMLMEKALDRERNEENDMKNLTNALQVYENRCNELVNINKDLTEKVDLLHNSIVATNVFPQKLEATEKEYYKEMAEKKYLSEQVTALKIEQESLKENNNDLLIQKQVLENNLTIISEEKMNLSTRIKDVEEKLLSLEHDNFSLLKQLEALKETQKELDPKLKQLENIVQEKEKDNRDLTSLIDRNQKIVQSLQKISDEKENRINDLTNKCNDLIICHTKDEQEILSLKQQNLQLEANLSHVQIVNKSALESLRIESESLATVLRESQEEVEVIRMQLQEREMQISMQLEMIESLKYTTMEDQNLREQVAIMEDALKDHENLLLQRDKLVQNQREFLTEIENLHQNLKKKQKKCDSLTKLCSKQTVQLKDLGKQLKIVKNDLNESYRNATCGHEIESYLREARGKLTEYETHFKKLESEVSKYKTAIKREVEERHEEKSALESTIREMQESHKKEIETFQHILDDIQVKDNTEHELKTILAGEIKKHKMIETEMEIASRNQQSLSSEIQTLKEHLQHAKASCRKLKDDFYLCHDEMWEREATFVKTIEEKNKELQEKENEIIEITNMKDKLAKDIETIIKDKSTIEEQNKKLEKYVNSHGKMHQDLEEAKRKSGTLEKQVYYLTLQYDKEKTIGSLLEKHKSEVTTALASALKELEETKEALRNLKKLHKEKSEALLDIEHMKVNHILERDQLLQEIKAMEADKMQYAQSTMEIGKVKELLEKEQQDLSDKLLKAVRLVLEEKLKHQKTECHVREMSHLIAQLQADKAAKEEHLRSLSNQVEDLKDQIHNINIDTENQINRLEDSEQISSMKLLVDDLHKNLLDLKNKNQKNIEKMEDLILVKEATIMEKNSKLSTFEERVNRLNRLLTETRDKLLNQREEHSKLEKEVINLQAEKRELTARLLEVEGHLKEETQLRQQLQSTSQKLFDEIAKSKQNIMPSQEELLSIFSADSPLSLSFLQTHSFSSQDK